MIYKLYSVTNPDLIYIGSTTKPLPVRLARHVLDHYRVKCGNTSRKVSSFDVIETGHYGIELIENCTIEERFKIEQKWIDTIKCVNKNKSYTGIEGNQKDKTSWAAYQKSHYALNRDSHIARKIRYYNANKDKIRTKYKVKQLYRHLPFSLV
jgi:hypothetical protein